jgi:kynurenine formamidase
MRLIDLTHPISPNMPAYPGTEPPVFETGCSIDDIGFLEKKITLYSHTGTHMDAPAHLIKGSKSLDDLPINHFYGNAFLLNCSNIMNQQIKIEDLEPHEAIIKRVEHLLIHTGWSQYWGTEKYFSDYPVLSIETAKWLSGFGLKGFGLDAISADEAETKDYRVHKTLLRNSTIIIENLTNLESLPCNQFIFSCFPLRFEKADGSPVRAVAFVD